MSPHTVSALRHLRRVAVLAAVVGLITLTAIAEAQTTTASAPPATTTTRAPTTTTKAPATATINWMGAVTIATIAVVLLVLSFDLVSTTAAMTLSATFLYLCGIIQIADVFAGFVNSGVLSIALFFIIVHPIADLPLTRWVVRVCLSGADGCCGKAWPLFKLCFVSFAISSFYENIPQVAMFTPLVKEVCHELGLSPAHFLLPMDYAVILGNFAVIGSSNNLVVSGLMVNKHMGDGSGMAFFELGKINGPFALVGLAYIIFIPVLILGNSRGGMFRLVKEKGSTFLLQLRVKAGSTLIGTPVENLPEQIPALHLHAADSVIELIEIIRDDVPLPPLTGTEIIHERDVLVITGNVELVVSTMGVLGLEHYTPEFAPSTSKSAPPNLPPVPVPDGASAESKSANVTQNPNNLNEPATNDWIRNESFLMFHTAERAVASEDTISQVDTTATGALAPITATSEPTVAITVESDSKQQHHTTTGSTAAEPTAAVANRSFGNNSFGNFSFGGTRRRHNNVRGGAVILSSQSEQQQLGTPSGAPAKKDDDASGPASLVAVEETANTTERVLFEAVLSTLCPSCGDTVASGTFQTRYSCAILAARKARENVDVVGTKLHAHVLRAGDTVLILAPRQFAAVNTINRHFFVVSGFHDHSKEVVEKKYFKFPYWFPLGVQTTNEEKAPKLVRVPWWWNYLALAAFLGVVGAAIGGIPIYGAALVGVCAVVGLGIMDSKQALSYIDLNSWTMVAMSFGLGTAMTTSGLANAIGVGLQNSNVTGFPLYILISVITMVLANVVTNKACVQIMFPIAYAALYVQHKSALPAVMLVASQSVMAFSTAFGYATNIIVMGPGGYSPVDFFKCGIPLNIVMCILSAVSASLVYNDW